MPKSIAGLALLLTVAAIFAVPAGAAEKGEEKGILSVLFENDIFYRTDRDYTNGAQIAWTTAPLKDADWVVRFAENFPLFSRGAEVRETYALGQDIFTPSNIKLKNPPLDEHPYAGYLYGALGLIAKTDNADGTIAHMDQMQLQLGVVGPDSLAKQTQTFVHRLIHDSAPQGWDTQLRNEPALELDYERTWRYQLIRVWDFALDAAPHGGGAIGNVYDYLNAGAMLRFGQALPDDFGPVRVDPGLPGSYFFEPGTGPVGWYIFAGVDGRAVARNIFLDGNTWAASRHVSKNNFVGDFQFGAALTLWGTRITYTHVLRSREFKTQHGADQFGAITASFRF